MTAPVLAACGVSKSYGEKACLRSLDREHAAPTPPGTAVRLELP